MNPPKESDMPPDPEHDSRLPQHEFDSEFCATEKYQKLVVCTSTVPLDVYARRDSTLAGGF